MYDIGSVEDYFLRNNSHYMCTNRYILSKHILSRIDTLVINISDASAPISKSVDWVVFIKSLESTEMLKRASRCERVEVIEKPLMNRCNIPEMGA